MEKDITKYMIYNDLSTLRFAAIVINSMGKWEK